jgi:DNA-binding NarL/FixJ family response regulator
VRGRISTVDKIRVLIVDDHPLMREGLQQLISAEPDMLVCGDAADAVGAKQAATALRPDVVVLDLTLGSDDGIALVQELRALVPELKILVVSMHDEALYAERLIALGARGYVMKQEPAEVFIGALRRVALGDHHISAALATRLYGRLARQRGTPATGHAAADGLTEREREVLRAIARGCSTQEIAAELGMSAKTVDSHRRNIREKLGLGSAGDLVRYAVQWESAGA